MGIPTKGILAPFKNRIGTVVGRRWRAGLWTMNSYQGEVKNPRTEAQLLQRMRFKALAKLAGSFVDCLDISMNYYLKTHPSTQVAEFIKRNNSAVTCTDLDSLNVDFTGLALCDGPLANVGFGAPNFDTPEQVNVTFKGCQEIASASAEDSVYLWVYCPDAELGVISAPVKRSAGTIECKVPKDWNGLKVHLWGFTTSDKKNRKRPNSVSASTYIGSGNIG